MKLSFPLPLLGLVLLLCLPALPSCVQVDPKTGETIPRGNQKLYFADVKQAAEKLKVGMTKWQVIMLLGSPAEKSKDDNTWVYVPERPAVLIPAEALKLRFVSSALSEFGYHPIILGARF